MDKLGEINKIFKDITSTDQKPKCALEVEDGDEGTFYITLELKGDAHSKLNTAIKESLLSIFNETTSENKFWFPEEANISKFGDVLQEIYNKKINGLILLFCSH